MMNDHAHRAMIVSVLAVMLTALPTLCLADGEPSSEAINSGALIPISDTHTHVLGQRIDIILPNPPREGQVIPAAAISVRYELENAEESPETIAVAWPSGGISGSIYTQDKPAYPIKITLDGKPLPFRFLRWYDLQEPYITGWVKQIDSLLESKPELMAKVAEVRKLRPNPRKPSDPHYSDYEDKCTQLAKQFGRWLVANRYHKDNGFGDCVAAGLLGVPIEGLPRDRGEQVALEWLDPKYKQIELNEELADRWGYGSLLLDPKTHWLTDLRGPMLYGVDFAVIRFDVTLNPKVKHVLNVSYKQELGWVDRGDWYGLAYFMQPARRWGRWDKTTITITAPNTWGKVVVRPTPSSATKTEKTRKLTIAMPRRPYEDLYISLVPPEDKTAKPKH